MVILYGILLLMDISSTKNPDENQQKYLMDKWKRVLDFNFQSPLSAVSILLEPFTSEDAERIRKANLYDTEST